jgi:hypothetical protein
MDCSAAQQFGGWGMADLIAEKRSGCYFRRQIVAAGNNNPDKHLVAGINKMTGTGSAVLELC